LTLALVLLLSTAASGVAGAGVEPREALANHTLKSLEGAETTLASYRGEVVVVNFWASWCAPCRKELPLLDGWHEAWKGRGARVVAISIDNELKNAKRFAEQTDLSLTILHDGPSGLAETLDLPSLPCTYLIDREGNVVKVIRSSSERDLETIQHSVESMLASTGTAGGTP
jgi:thiol-disulfide isomerase/thioredoxin